jgi:signal transduction histidine kinase
MKLFTRYSRINVLATIAIFLVASVAFYFSLRYVFLKQIDEDLEIEENEITAYVQKYNRLPENFPVTDQVISFSPADQNIKRQFARVKMVDKEDRREGKYRQLIFGVKAGGQWYKASVFKLLEGSDNLLRSILLISFSTILAILIVSFIINRVVLKKIWKPFYQSLNAVRNFRISKEQALLLPETKIDEFRFMNQTLEGITKTSQLEYLSLKTFSENASHEIQTPIAIIRTKLDLLIQDEQLTESRGKILQSTYNAIEKLSRLNQSLLLLAKIGNRQFEEVEVVDVKKMIGEKLLDFQEIWDSQSIDLHTSLETSSVKMNKELADILLNNLLSNATRYNCPGGSITIRLNQQQLSITNTSREPALDTAQIFHRFYKPSSGNQHNGLGLSIIKQITDASGFLPSYAYQNNEHTFTVAWDQ